MTRRPVFCLLSVVSVALCWAAQSGAALYLYEPFDYSPNQGLAGVNGQVANDGTTPPTGLPHGQVAPNGNSWMTTAYGGAGFNPYSQANDAVTSAVDLSYSNLVHTPSGSVEFGGQGTTPRLAFTPINNNADGSSNHAYYSFVFRVTSLAGTNAAGGLIAGFNNTRGTQSGNPNTIGASVFAKASGAGFVIGVLEQGNDASVATYDTNVLSFNQDYFVVGKYTINGTFNMGTNDDTAQIWINPTSLGGAEPIGALVAAAQRTDVPTNGGDGNSTVQSFILRQNGINTGAVPTQSVVGHMYFDELRIGTTYADVTPIVPEPGNIALAGVAVGALAAFGRRTRKRLLAASGAWRNN